ncbi:hypothetical protein [Pseudoalteromonas espejiana]|uniref:Uncharacterized protein n=1 Tax=Pseudoalteromonas espejiana TaxID=28107 RepID=A0A510XQA1_9GAMM|nr:hypothetical protein [Pseudoalteromonas espejiana]GEK53212.1 hypothetical protein PES01_00570 [Pseudoalteromonas espejiana]
MDITKQKKHEIVKRINYEIEVITEKCCQQQIKSQLITPSWNFDLDSVIATTKHYESIMNQVISLQFDHAKSNSINTIVPDGIMNNLANILIILNIAAELFEQREQE